MADACGCGNESSGFPLKKRVLSVHITSILHLVNYLDSEDGTYKFLQNFAKTFQCHIVPKFSKEFPCGK